MPPMVHKIEGGYPERDIGAEEGQGWGDSRRLMINININMARRAKIS